MNKIAESHIRDHLDLIRNNFKQISFCIEKIAADSLLTFNILAPVMVTPALLAPGIKAKT